MGIYPSSIHNQVKMFACQVWCGVSHIVSNAAGIWTMYVTCHCNTTELLFRVSHFMWELVRWIHPPYTWMSRLNIFLTRVKKDYIFVLNRRNQQNTLKTWQTIDSASFVCGKQNNFYFWFIVLVALSTRDDVCMGHLFLDIFFWNLTRKTKYHC